MILSVMSLAWNRAVSYIFRAWAFNKSLKIPLTEYWSGVTLETRAYRQLFLS